MSRHLYQASLASGLCLFSSASICMPATSKVIDMLPVKLELCQPQTACMLYYSLERKTCCSPWVEGKMNTAACLS